jgi:hypothetical protein
MTAHRDDGFLYLGAIAPGRIEAAQAGRRPVLPAAGPR